MVTTSRTARILVVDDHPIVREGLCALLHRLPPGYDILPPASSGAEALESVLLHRPDVVLMDISLPGESGLELTRRIKHDSPDTVVILLTMYDNDSYLLEAMQAGATGYLLKGDAPELVPMAIACALQGASIVPSTMLQRILTSVHRPSHGPSPELTARELLVLSLLAQGNSNRSIAKELCLAEVTVKKHIQSLMGKLGTSDRTQTALLAVRHGLVD